MKLYALQANLNISSYTKTMAWLKHTQTATKAFSTDNKTLHVYEYSAEGNCPGFHNQFSAISWKYKTVPKTHKTSIPYALITAGLQTLHNTLKRALDKTILSIIKTWKYIALITLLHSIIKELCQITKDIITSTNI